MKRLITMMMMALTVGLAFGQAPKETFEQTLEKANQGDVIAMTKMGSYYQSGDYGVAKDINQAISWYKKAAEMGSAHAAKMLGVIYQLGIDVKKDDNEAQKWKAKAKEIREKKTPELVEKVRNQINQGDAKAMVKMGYFYETGNTLIAQDYNEALSWYKKAFEKGEGTGAIFIGNLYRKGLGVTKDYDEALKWYTKAQEMGVPIAAQMIEEVNSDKEKAEKEAKARALWEANRTTYTASEVANMSPEKQMLTLKRVVMKEKLDQAAFSISKCYANGEAYLRTKDGRDVEIARNDYEKTKVFTGLNFQHNNDSALVWCKRCVEYGNLEQNYYKGAEYQVKKYGKIVSYEQGKLLMDYKDERAKAKKVLDKYKNKYGVNFYTQLCVNGNITNGMPLAMIVEYAEDVSALDRVANVLVIRFFLKEYQPTVQDVMQGGKNVRVYQLFGGSDAGYNNLYYKLLCVNGKVVKAFRYRNDYLSLADYRLDEINTLENSLKNGIALAN